MAFIDSILSHDLRIVVNENLISQDSLILAVQEQGQGWAIRSAKSQEPGDYHFKTQLKKFTINASLIVPPQFRCQGSGTLTQQP